MDENDIDETIETLRGLHKPINGGFGFFGIGAEGVLSRLTTLRGTEPADWFDKADNPDTQFVAGIELMTSIFDTYCGSKEIDEADRDAALQDRFQSEFIIFGTFTPDDSRAFAVTGGA